MRLRSGKVEPAMLFKERGFDWVRPALLPCQWVQPCPDGHKTSSHLIHPRAGSFSMKWGCPVVREPGFGDTQHFSPGQRKKHALEWAATALPLRPCLSFPLKTGPSSAAKGSAAMSQACSSDVPRCWPFKLVGLWYCRNERGGVGDKVKGTIWLCV